MVNGPDNARALLVFAHGAGAPMDSEFMESMAEQLAMEGLKVIRFEFPYMNSRRETGKKRPPDRQPVLVQRFAEVVAQVSAGQPGVPVFVGGKSMGGRMASILASLNHDYDLELAGWFALGYPFHPPGKPEKLRVEHFSNIECRGLVCQGSRDPFGRQDEDLQQYCPANIQLVWLEDGNHDLAPRKSSGVTVQENRHRAIQTLSKFVNSIIQG